MPSTTIPLLFLKTPTPTALVSPMTTAWLAKFSRPRPSENFDPLPAASANAFRTAVDPTRFFKSYNPSTGFEAPLHSPALPKIDNSVGFDSQDSSYNNADSPAQPDFGSDAFYQSKPFVDENQASATSSFNENRTYTLPAHNENQAFTSIYDVNQAHKSVCDVNRLSSSVAPLPSQLNFTPPANFNPLPTWNVSATTGPSFDIAPYFSPAGSSSASHWSLAWSQSPSPTRATPDLPQLPSGLGDLAPSTRASSVFPESETETALEVEHAPDVPQAHSSVGSARRSRVLQASQGPSTLARRYTTGRNDPTQSFIPGSSSGDTRVRDCPLGYSIKDLPVSGVEVLKSICSSLKPKCYHSDAHGCCINGCPDKHSRYTRRELRKHLKTHSEIRQAQTICPICGTNFQTSRSVSKHIENKHCNWHVLCAFCLLRHSVPENLYRHFATCPSLHPPTA